MYTVAPFTVLMGRSFNALIWIGLLLTWTWYSVFPSLAVPAGRIRFCRFSAFDTSIGESCLAYNSSRLRSTMTARCFPPKGYETEAPCTVPSGVRMKLFPRSKISCSRSVLLERPNCRMGTLEASYLRMLAGNIPGGIWRSAVCMVAVI